MKTGLDRASAAACVHGNPIHSKILYESGHIGHLYERKHRDFVGLADCRSECRSILERPVQCVQCDATHYASVIYGGHTRMSFGHMAQLVP